MLSLSKAIKQRQKVMEKDILHNISTQINDIRKTNKNRLPHKFVENMIDKTIGLCPWLTYNKVINYNRKHDVPRQATNR